MSLKTQLKIEFLPPHNSGKKGLEKSLDFDETWLPFSTKLSAFCYKIVVQLITHSFPYNGRFGLLIDLVVNTGGKNITGNDNSKDTVYSILSASYITLENVIVKNYDQSFP